MFLIFTRFQKIRNPTFQKLIRIREEEIVIIIYVFAREQNGTSRAFRQSIRDDNIAVWGYESKKVLEGVFVIVPLLDDEREFIIAKKIRRTKIVDDDLYHGLILHFDERFRKRVSRLGESTSGPRHRYYDVEHVRIRVRNRTYRRFTNGLRSRP